MAMVVATDCCWRLMKKRVYETTSGRYRNPEWTGDSRELSGLRTIRERRSSHRYALASFSSPIKTQLLRRTVKCKVLPLSAHLALHRYTLHFFCVLWDIAKCFRRDNKTSVLMWTCDYRSRCRRRRGV